MTSSSRFLRDRGPAAPRWRPLLALVNEGCGQIVAVNTGPSP